jgi:transglutaminase-like putative cysteine protease
MERYLKPTFYFDYQEDNVKEFIYEFKISSEDLITKAKNLYLLVRDGFQYNPYQVVLHPNALKLSYLITKKTGYCVEKSIILAGLARAIGIPSRLGFANVRNHLGTEKIERILGTDVLVFHGYCELYLNNRWVKATPAFNKELCQKFGVEPLEFNGTEDSIFQPYNAEGNLFMEYLMDHGTFEDMPFELFRKEFYAYYGHLVNKKWEDMYVTEEFPFKM